MSFASRVVWITGASSGIGEALSRALLADGAAVILSGRRVEALQQLAALAPERTLVLPLKLPTTSVCQSWWSRPGHGRVALTC
ncbi:SDR family NAD(P)-dependent oxidoreductase [Halopseudomonas pachastrellae]|nr:SDR family NAD(P)-dependent oxidoreductase [Halopseudomonas pachastrellae]